MPDADRSLYLTFDDGPHPAITTAVLDLLAQYNARATFFCIGDRVTRYPEVYQRILAEGHAVGNHTYRHLHGRKNADEDYLEDIRAAARFMDTRLFRPPYGRIKRSQIKSLKKNNTIPSTSQKILLPNNIIMWDVLSGDFDVQLSPENCCSNVLLNVQPGSIIVFHDSAKAWERMAYALPKVLDHFTQLGYRFEKIVLP
jgi:peptidoglycan/xylan/chitin deacetylase (PgdA/CDA1 family)